MIQLPPDFKEFLQLLNEKGVSKAECKHQRMKQIRGQTGTTRAGFFRCLFVRLKSRAADSEESPGGGSHHAVPATRWCGPSATVVS